MKKYARILSMATVATLTATSLTACGNGGDTPTNADGAVVVDFWHSSSGAAGQTLQELVDQFNEEHKGEIEILASYQGDYGDSISKFVASVQTGDLPALLQANDVQTRYLKDSGLALPAQDLAEEDESYDFSVLIPAVANYYTMDDKVFSMPAMVSQPALFTNDTLLAEAGVDPESLTTLDGLLDAVEQIHEATGRAGLTFHQSGWYMEQTMSMLGNEFCLPENGVGAEQPTEFDLTNPELVSTWTRIGELYDSGAIHNPGNDGSAATGAFLSQEAAIQMNSSSNYGNVAEANLDWDWSIRSLPRDTAEAGAVPGGNSLWAIAEGTSEEEQAAAWEFMKFIGSDESQMTIFQETGYLPTTSSAAENLTDLTPQHESLLDQLTSTPVNTVTAGCHSGALNDARTSYGEAMSTIANGANADEALQTAKEGADQSITSYNERAGNQ
ncbi:extracellular solute-binding protein [Corynebacterium timonense]|uniref:sn-glycerol 3-phosphate transport system substrate-binding protein n=1 Tax=Corynebacterium timonense TaxID=441500 RepID=A0A1H1SB38_9CORY|nr:extracellular solute-binding protein [Corynebacterium timonense]SDS44539.1 sn-glycerol 3-phosphate transport system substrate-binding protein [Corynebacterium timonense]